MTSNPAHRSRQLDWSRKNAFRTFIHTPPNLHSSGRFRSHLLLTTNKELLKWDRQYPLWARLCAVHHCRAMAGRSSRWPCRCARQRRFKSSSALVATHVGLRTTGHPLVDFAVDVHLMRLAHSGGRRLISGVVRLLQASCGYRG